MAAGSVGDKASNIIPHQAIAELDLRTTPGTPPAYLFGLLQKHVEAQGYHLVNGPPTDDERAGFAKLATLTMGTAGRAVRTPLDAPLGNWVHASLAQTSQTGAPVRIRMMGGSVPTDTLVELLGACFLIVPLVNTDNNQHTFDENMRVGTTWTEFAPPWACYEVRIDDGMTVDASPGASSYSLRLRSPARVFGGSSRRGVVFASYVVRRIVRISDCQAGIRPRDVLTNHRRLSGSTDPINPADA